MLTGSIGMLVAQSAFSVLARATSPSPGEATRTPIDLERFVEGCVEASRESDAQEAVREVLARAVSDPGAALAAVGEPTRAGLTVFHRSETLTIFSAAWAPQMNLMPHDHKMWALIGIYTGREDNIFWRRDERGVSAVGVECLFEGDVGVLPVDAIHSVTNPLERWTGGIHIYGGDFFATTRSQWDPETLEEQPSDGDVIRAMFERANQRMERLGGG
jgi:predicted metal-dependent enzyme (double-stranded beta helix superfamily)